MMDKTKREREIFLSFFYFSSLFLLFACKFFALLSLFALSFSPFGRNNNDEKRHTFLRKTSSTTHLANNNNKKKKRKMEVEEEHEVLRAVRRNAERLSSSSSNNNDNIDDDNKDNAEAISSCLRSLRAHFCRGGGQKGKKKRDEVSAKDCLRVRGGFVFCNCFFMNARALSSILFLSLSDGLGLSLSLSRRATVTVTDTRREDSRDLF
jgi:hypothetical protein